MPETTNLDEVRYLILLKLGIKIISPSDCRFISTAIQKEIHKYISETTIKRLFGFAEFKSQFSTYTINTLKEFVESKPKSEELILSSKHTGNNDDLLIIKQKANVLTNATLRHIRNRSSLPYDMTIGRKFAKYDFAFFYSSEQSFTSFISQPGYGKSILLSHLVVDLFLRETAIHKNDVILFLNAIDFFDTQYEPYSISDRIKKN